jgi:hypothetical protein
MRSRLLPLALLLAVVASGFALASAVAVSAPIEGNWRVVAYVPLIVQGAVGAQPAATIAQAATETPTVTASPTATNTPTATPANCDPDADLSGELIGDSLGRIVNASDECSYDVGLASYRALDRHISNQQLFDSQTASIAPGQALELAVAVPDCASQIDLFYGPLLLSLDGQRYGERLLDSHFAGGTDFCPPGTPAATRTATPTSTSGTEPTNTPSPSPTEEPTITPGGGG